MAKCKYCGADIVWTRDGKGWIAYNSEDFVDDERDNDIAPHYRTCRKPKTEEKPLSREARTRPGYL